MHKSFDMHNKLRFFVHDNINIHKKQPKFEYKGYIKIIRIYAKTISWQKNKGTFSYIKNQQALEN